MPTHPLQPRSLPAQSRSRATVDLVLDSAADLLDEVGLEGFNTNLLAERAGVSVRAIYRYFPNKLAVLVALAERMRGWERTWIGDLAPQAGEPWRAALDRAIDGYFRTASAQRGVASLRAAMLAVPELRAVEAAASADYQAELARGLTALGVAAPPERLAAVSLVVVESASHLLDVALVSSPGRAALLLDELKRMLANLLADYLEPGRPA